MAGRVANWLTSQHAEKWATWIRRKFQVTSSHFTSIFGSFLEPGPPKITTHNLQQDAGKISVAFRWVWFKRLPYCGPLSRTTSLVAFILVTWTVSMAGLLTCEGECTREPTWSSSLVWAVKFLHFLKFRVENQDSPHRGGGCWLVVWNLFIFTSTWGDDPIWRIFFNIFQTGWNHQVDNLSQLSCFKFIEHWQHY